MEKFRKARVLMDEIYEIRPQWKAVIQDGLNEKLMASYAIPKGERR